ncbi:MAG: type VI secretion system tip protein VgrG [Gammaproteobacteria bacterium]|nr:type VI secretion system tip protein VgrG [Gammaproteobacteria bacterium]
MPTTQQNREVEIATPLGDDVLLLRDMTITEELGRLYTINLQLNSTENINFEDLLGQNVTIRLNMAGENIRYFNGYVGSISQAVDEGHYAVYQATVHPWLWFLTRTSDCRIFQNKTVPEIIKDIFHEHGFTDFEDRLSASYRNWEYCVQYRETDFNFVSRLMEQEGIYYYFIHENGKHTLNLADGYSSHDAIPDHEEIPYYPPDDVATRDEERITSWYLSKKIQPGTYVLNDYDFKRPKADQLVDSSISRDFDKANYEIYDYPGEYVESEDGTNYARKRIEELHTQYEQAEGESDVRGLVTGGLFSLTDYPREDQNREYLVISATHSISSDSFEAGESSGGPVYVNTFTVIDSQTAFRPVRSTPKPVIQGPQTAFVVGKSGEEIWTEEYARVKVLFHWDRESQADENSSCWIRVAQPIAGKGWGTSYIPRIGQEVLVTFLEGDPDRPIITGSVYNDVCKPPYSLPAEATKTTFKSNSSKGGGGFNEIRFEDKKGQEQVFIHAEKSFHQRVKSDSFETIGNERHLIVKKDKLEQVDGDKHITVRGDLNNKINGTVSNDIGGDYQEKIGMKYGLDAGMEVHLKAGMNVVIEAGMSITLKAGGGFIVVGPAGVTISGTPVLINSGGSAGSGSGCSPDAAKPPKEAVSAKPGQVAAPPVRTLANQTQSTQAQVLVDAARDGTPFCEQCEAARQAAADSSSDSSQSPS